MKVGPYVSTVAFSAPSLGDTKRVVHTGSVPGIKPVSLATYLKWRKPAPADGSARKFLLKVNEVLQRSRLGRVGPGGECGAGCVSGDRRGRLAPQAPPQAASSVGRERSPGRGEPAPMRITDMFRFAAERGEPVFSFEFFPPKNDAGVASLFESLRALRPLGPSFVSVTWGAGGLPD